MSSYTYTGPWINYSHGSIKGATLTLSQRDGILLTAFISAFVVFVGGRFWSICSFFMYQAMASEDKVDALHRQHQVILRNTESAGGAWWEFLLLPFSWRRKPTAEQPGRRQFWHAPKRLIWIVLVRSWALSLLGLLVFVGFAGAGVFSSEASKAAGSDTLIRSNNCGTWNIPSINVHSVPDFSFKLLNDTITAANYARTCYGTNSKAPQCNTFVKQQITWSTTMNAPCPFASGFCYYNDSAALQLNTGLIDSHDDLGINAHPQDRIKYRKQTTCSVILPTTRDADKVRVFNESSGKVYRYYYGEQSGVAGSNWTFQYSDVEKTLGLGYDLSTDYAQMNSNDNIWIPESDLNTTTTNGDITLVWLAQNGVQSTQPIDDPFFLSHTNLSLTLDGVGFQFYGSDYVVHVMACVDQHQFCNPSRLNESGTTACTDLSGYFPVDNAIQTIGYNNRQLATAYRFLNSIRYGQIFHSISGRGSAALRANELVYELLQSPLPTTQWVTEVSNWFAVSLSRLQHTIVEFASGPTSLPPEATVITPTESGWPVMCSSQKVRDSGAHQNFSILALGLIFGLGVLIIILSWTLEPCINSHRRKRNPCSHRRIQWILDGKLQLMRMVYQYTGVEGWEGKARDVPTTMPLDEEKIYMLPSTIDPENPGLSDEHDVWTPAGPMNGQPMNGGVNGANGHGANP